MRHNSIWQTGFIFVVTLVAILSAYEVGYIVNNVVTIWPATAVIYWAIRHYGLSGFIGTALAGCIHSYAWLNFPLLNLLIPLSSSLCAWGAVLVERYFNPSGDIFDGSHNMLVFLTLGIGGFSLSSAIIGNILISVQFGVPWSAYGNGVWNWFLADYTGGIMLAPLLLILPLFHKQVVTEWRTAVIEAILSLLLLALITLVFLSGIMKNYGTFSPLFLALPGAIYMSTRGASARVCLCFFLFTVAALMMTVTLGGNTEDNVGLRTVQLYLTIVLVCGLILHSVRIERGKLIKKLADERRQLEIRVQERTAELSREVSEKKEIALKMEALARIDPLTKLYNRRYFAELAARDLIRGQRNKEPVSLCMLDIDYFKTINDTYGHPTGDSVLVELADILLAEIRHEIDSVVRLGGEEFAILMPQTPIKLAKEVCERIRHRVASHNFKVDEEAKIKPKQLLITISIGIIECPLLEDTIDSSISAADKALYQAKHEGRNCVVCGELSRVS